MLHRTDTKDLLESGKFGSVKELAAAVGLERSYVAKLLNLTLLAPKIVEAVVVGDEPGGMSVAELRQGVAVRWEEQWPFARFQYQVFDALSS